MELEYLQIYWWLIISILGALLVFLLFVQGGQTFLLSVSDNSEASRRMISSFGHKWELSFTTLVVFGGAFFASFPLFYSTSFGGAYWLWMLILISFVLQAVSYEFRAKKGNIYGTRTYDSFLYINGCVGCILLGVAVSMFFFGSEFTVTKGNILDTSAPVISVWAPTHGFEAIFNWKNLVLGFAVLFLARTQAALYLINNNPQDDAFFSDNRRRVLVNAVLFLVFFLLFVGLLLTTSALETSYDGSIDGRASEFTVRDYKYFFNFLDLPAALIGFLAGVVAVLYAIIRTVVSRHWTAGIWWSGIGSILVVLALFWIAGYNNTPYYPSLTDPASSLTIFNSSSSLFTLKCMSYVSIIIPFVVGYIAYAWYAMDRKSE